MEMAAPDAGGGGLHGAAGVPGVRAARQPVRAAQVRSTVVACVQSVHFTVSIFNAKHSISFIHNIMATRY